MQAPSRPRGRSAAIRYSRILAVRLLSFISADQLQLRRGSEVLRALVKK